MTPRRASTSHVGPAPASSPAQVRTAAATAARRSRYVQQQAEKFGWLIPEMTDGQLGALAGLIDEELQIRHGVMDLVRQPDGIPPACAESGCTECVQIRHAAAVSGDEREA